MKKNETRTQYGFAKAKAKAQARARAPKPTADQREIARLNKVVEDLLRFADERKKELREREEQIRQQDRIMQSKIDDHNFELNRLGARNSALEYALVMAHGAEGRLVASNRALRKGRAQDSFAMAVADETAEGSAAPAASPMRFKRIGDRWELVIP